MNGGKSEMWRFYAKKPTFFYRSQKGQRLSMQMLYDSRAVKSPGKKPKKKKRIEKIGNKK